MGRRYATPQLLLRPGTKWSATTVFLTALTDRVHSVGGLTSERNYFSLIYHEAFPKYVENAYCQSYTSVTVIEPKRLPRKNLFHWTLESRSRQSCSDPLHLSSNHQGYVRRNNVPHMTQLRKDHAAQLLTMGMFYFNSLPDSPKNMGHISPNLNE
jgi:hypothetical protein